jgi:hypothetical protein
MYTDGPSLSSARLTKEQANPLRAQSKRQSDQEPEQRQPTPVASDDESEDYFQASTQGNAKKKTGRAGGLATDIWKG